MEKSSIEDIQKFLTVHRTQFYESAKFATLTGQPVPSDTRAWSQILVSLLSGIRGQDRAKGPDFKDGSDVKAANTWLAIDTPRFNGCLPCGRTSVKSNIGESVDSLQKEPYLYFALWDTEEVTKIDRCRVWVVRPFQDALFKEMAREWYAARAAGIIKSDNFQLHPPRNKNNDVLKNTYGTFSYPKLLDAVWDGLRKTYEVSVHSEVLINGVCT